MPPTCRRSSPAAGSSPGVAADTYLLGSRNPRDRPDRGLRHRHGQRDRRRRSSAPPRATSSCASSPPPTGSRCCRTATVDIVARNMTINCARWEQIAFSADYYHAGQKVLVGRDSGITTIEDLAGKRVCAPAGTTSIDNIQKIAARRDPGHRRRQHRLHGAVPERRGRRRQHRRHRARRPGRPGPVRRRPRHAVPDPGALRHRRQRRQRRPGRASSTRCSRACAPTVAGRSPTTPGCARPSASRASSPSPSTDDGLIADR